MTFIIQSNNTNHLAAESQPFPSCITIQMTCPFMQGSSSAKLSDPSDYEIELACPVLSISDIPAKFLSSSQRDPQNKSLFSQFPIYLKNTLSHPLHIQELRSLRIEDQLLAFADFTKAGNRHFHSEEFEKSIECYEHSYSIFRYLSVKACSSQKLAPEDVRVVTVDCKEPAEARLRNSAMVRVLSNLAQAFVRLRYYHEAMLAVNEALEIAPEEPQLLATRARIRLCNVKDQMIDSALADIENAAGISKGFQKLVQKFHEARGAREKIVEDVIGKIAGFYSELNWEYSSEVSGEKELEHIILGEMEKKYYEMIQFYLESGKMESLARIREEMKNLQMVLYKIDLAFGLDGEDERFGKAVMEKSGKNEIIKINPLALDIAKRTCITFLFSEGKFNNQMLAYCIEKCSAEEREKNVRKNESSWLDCVSIPILLLILSILLAFTLS